MSQVEKPDYRALQTSVRNQGDRPTCVGFAVSAAHEWMARDNIIRSPEDVIWAGHQEGGPAAQEATSVRLALAGLKRFAHTSEKAWPYSNPRWPADRPLAAADENELRELPQWRQLDDYGLPSIESELVEGHAVLLTLAFVPAAWRLAGGVIDIESGRRTRGNHAVLAVGIVTGMSGAGDSVIIKNSWGENWGLAGYGFVSSRYLAAYTVRVHVMER
jgi:C1A family cysteine protease